MAVQNQNHKFRPRSCMQMGNDTHIGYPFQHCNFYCNRIAFSNASGNSCIYSRIYSVAVIRRWLSCKTPFRCWVISNFLLIAALLIVRYVSHFTAFFLLLTALSLLCLVVLMPVSDIHKKLSEKDRKKYRRKGLMILMVELCASAMLYYFALINFSYSIFSAWILLSIMLIGGMIKNGVQAKK